MSNSLIHWMIKKTTSASSQSSISQPSTSTKSQTVEVELNIETSLTESDSTSKSARTELAETPALQHGIEKSQPQSNTVSECVTDPVAQSCDSDVEIFDATTVFNEETSKNSNRKSRCSTSKDGAHNKKGKFHQKKGPRKTKKNEPYKQRFRDQWLSDPECIGWLEKRITGNKEAVAYCLPCAEFFTAGTGLSELKRHKMTSKHERSAHLTKLIDSQRKQISEACNNFSQENNVVVLATRMCIFLAENNLSLSLIDQLIPLLRCCFPHDECLRKLKLAKQKASNIIRFGIGAHLESELIQQLKKHFFSIIIDETTDVTTSNQIAVMIKYWDALKQKLIVDILDLVQCQDATANGLTQAVVDLLTKSAIQFERVVGFSADTCNVMFGKNHSVSTLLKELMPNLLTVPCSCHSAHLCASYACKRLPKEMEDVLRGIYNHFSRSSARKREFSKFQEFVHAAEHTILSPGQTRWLSEEACVNRILEQREALILYFQAESAEDPTAANTLIHTMLNNEMTVPFLEFTLYALNCFNEFNTLFQSASPKLHLLQERVSCLIKDFAQNFMHFKYVVDNCPTKIDPYLSTQFVPLEKVYLGMAATESIKKISQDNQQFVIKHCRSFYIQAILEIQNRYNLYDPFFKIVKLVQPVNARKRNPDSLIALFKQYPNLESQLNGSHADRKWRSHSHLEPILLNCNTEDEVRVLDAETYWNRVLSLKIDGKPRFPNLSICIEFLFSMPFSNVIAEREFSAFKLIKTDHRNPLHNLTVCSLLRIKHWGSNEEHSASNVVITKSLADKVKSVKANVSIEAGVLRSL